MMYEVLTGHEILLFQTLADAITCARFIKGVVRNPTTHEIYADFFNED